MFKKSLILILAMGVGIVAQANAAVAEFNILEAFEAKNTAIQDGEIHFGDNWLTHENLDFYERKNVGFQFTLDDYDPLGSVSISLTYSGVDLPYNYFSINNHKFSYLEYGSGSVTMDASIAELGLKDNGADRFRFHLDWMGSDLEDLDITEFIMSYDTLSPSGGVTAPLPTAGLLLGCGLIGLAGFRRRQG